MTENAAATGSRMTRRGAFAAASVMLLIVAVTLPTEWYDTIPRLPDLRPLPIRGVTLLRMTIVLEALVFGLLALRDWSFESDRESIAAETPETEVPGDVSPSAALVTLAVITVITIAILQRRAGK